MLRLLSALLLVYLLGFVAFAIMLPRPADDRQTDAVVALTGGPGRIERGLNLLRQGRARRMLISGVDRRVRPHELAKEYGVPDSLVDAQVDLGHESVDTRSNADETAAWLKRRRYKSVRLVTTDWHMPRARFELARVLPEGVTLIADPVPSEPSLVVLVREYSKYVLRRAAALLGV